MRDQAPLRKSGVPHCGGDFVISFSPHSTTYATFLGSLVVTFVDCITVYYTYALGYPTVFTFIISFSDILSYIRTSMPWTIYPYIMNRYHTTMTTPFEVEVEP